MARKKRNRPGQRDGSLVASLPAARSVKTVAPLMSDRRLFHPEGVFQPPYSPKKSQRRIIEHVVEPRRKVARSRKSYAGALRSVFRFAVPKKVEVCVRRKSRREVLFALGRTGRGAKKRYRRRGYYSSVSCR